MTTWVFFVLGVVFSVVCGKRGHLAVEAHNLEARAFGSRGAQFGEFDYSRWCRSLIKGRCVCVRLQQSSPGCFANIDNSLKTLSKTRQGMRNEILEFGNPGLATIWKTIKIVYTFGVSHFCCS